MKNLTTGFITGFFVATFCSMVVLGEVTNRVNHNTFRDFDGAVTCALRESYSNPIASLSIKIYSFCWGIYKSL
ncbi:MAG: hypothetical protein JW919_06250 [Candidatus Omnitrophica bacterium]|nr:hypothetical protein [Candidatus Omnitrophota bacterium]